MASANSEETPVNDFVHEGRLERITRVTPGVWPMVSTVATTADCVKVKVENRNYSWHFLIQQEQNVQCESLFSHLDVSCCLSVIQTLG